MSLKTLLFILSPISIPALHENEFRWKLGLGLKDGAVSSNSVTHVGT